MNFSGFCLQPSKYNCFILHIILFQKRLKRRAKKSGRDATGRKFGASCMRIVQESDVGFTKDHRETIGLLVRAFDER